MKRSAGDVGVRKFKESRVLERTAEKLDEMAVASGKELERKADFITTVLLPIAKKEREELTADEIKRAMEICCYGNLSYCCGLEKPCVFRDAVRTALKISGEEFRSKESWVFSLILRG